MHITLNYPASLTAASPTAQDSLNKLLKELSNGAGLFITLHLLFGKLDACDTDLKKSNWRWWHMVWWVKINYETNEANDLDRGDFHSCLIVYCFIWIICVENLKSNLLSWLITTFMLITLQLYGLFWQVWWRLILYCLHLWLIECNFQ